MGIGFSDGSDFSGGDNGGFGYIHKSVEIVKGEHENVQLGAEPLPEESLVMVVMNRLDGVGIDTRRIAIEREERQLFLRGSVNTAELSETAESIALGTPGVTGVVNELSVSDVGTDVGVDQ